MGLTSEIRQIARTVFHEEMKQLDLELRDGAAGPKPAVAPPSEPRAAAPPQPSATPGEWRDRRTNPGRRRTDHEQDVLRRILAELRGLRDPGGSPRKYVTLVEAQRLVGCGRTKMLELCRERVIETFREGKVRMVTVASLERYVETRCVGVREQDARAPGAPERRRSKAATEPQRGNVAAAIAAIKVK